MHYDIGQKQLCFLVKERVTAEPNLQLHFRGMLNTVTGGFDYRGTLKKYVQSGSDVKGEGTQPLRVGGGVAISSATGDEPFLTLAAKKKIALLEGPDTILHAKASLDWEPRTFKVRLPAGLHAQAAWQRRRRRWACPEMRCMELHSHDPQRKPICKPVHKPMRCKPLPAWHCVSSIPMHSISWQFLQQAHAAISSHCLLRRPGRRMQRHPQHTCIPHARMHCSPKAMHAAHPRLHR